MFKVRLVYPWNGIEKQSPDSACIWGDYQFYLKDTESEYDFCVVYGYLPAEEVLRCPAANTIFVTAEPETVQQFNADFLGQFAHMITCQRGLAHPHPTYQLQALPWHVQRGYDQLKAEEPKKNKKISVISSNKLMTEGHRKRYDFVMGLKKHFGDQIDVYGRGINEINDKWEALADYKYSIAIENSAFQDYATEKISDCFLAMTFPIYFGCPNIGDYYDRNAFAEIDINDLPKSIKVIEDILKDENHYESRIEDLREAKRLTLDKYSMFPMLVEFIEAKHLQPGNNTIVHLKLEEFFVHTPRVSVVMPAFNAAPFIAESIATISNQSFTDFEFLITEDNSTDDTVEVIKQSIKKDKRIRLFANKYEKGIVGALNTSLDAARGEFIARMDGDDHSRPARFAEQIKFLNAHPDVGVVGTWIKVFGTHAGKVWRHPTDHATIRSMMLFYQVLCHPSVMMRRGIFTDNNLRYDQNFCYSEDFDLFTKLITKVKFANLPKILFDYRTHYTNVYMNHGERQRKNSDVIRERQLRALGVEMTDEELAFHQRISVWDFEQNADFLKRAYLWLHKLNETNKQHHVYDQKAFAKVLAYKWLDVYKVGSYLATDVLREYGQKQGFGLQGLDKMRFSSAMLMSYIYKLLKKVKHGVIK